VSIRSRLKALEQRQQETLNTFRVVVRCVYGPPDLAKYTCKRTICPNGQILEYVHLEGGREGLSDEALDAWVQTFPIERVPRFGHRPPDSATRVAADEHPGDPFGAA